MVHDNTINGIISWFHTRVKVHDLDTLMLPDMNQPLMLFNTSPERRSLMHYNLGLVLKYSGYIQMYYTHFYLTLIHCIRALLSSLSCALITVTHRITPNVTVMRCDSNEEIAINMVVTLYGMIQLAIGSARHGFLFGTIRLIQQLQRYVRDSKTVNVSHCDRNEAGKTIITDFYLAFSTIHGNYE